MMFLKIKKLLNIGQNCSVNFVLNNLVNEEVQSMFLPLNLMQHFMLCPKYRVRNHLITPNSLISNFVSIIGTLLFIFSLVYHMTLLSYLDCPECLYFSNISEYFDCIFYCAGFTLNLVLGIIHSKKNIKFVLTFQQVHTFLNDEISSKRFIIWNWIIIISFQIVYVFLYTYFFIRLRLPLFLLYGMLLLVFMNYNIIYATRVIKLLEDKVVLWNIQALHSQNIGETLKQRHCEKVFQAYVSILECYDIYKDCFQQLILYHIIAVLIHSLIYIHMVIETWKNGLLFDKMDDATISSLPLLIWVIKDLMWQTVLNQQCEKFYLAVRSVQDSCAIILKSKCSDEEKKLCRNVLRLHRASFSKIRVCGLFYVDAASQLSLMSLLTNYTVVILQFAIL